ncbi:MAG: hypothetical protein ACRDDY_08705 [Clostridium sp.]|uniref:hypothetical protein n=1 Tax=Clostridium sp. TaxID=1506 RepID=UPI003EE4BB45
MFERYYEKICIFIKKYISNIGDIYAEPEKYAVGKKYLVGKFCESLVIILKKEKINISKIQKIYIELIEILEKSISNKKDFRQIFAGKKDSYSSFINSVHYNLIKLEIVFMIKLKNIEKLDEKYSEKIILRRERDSVNEFYMFLGEDLSSFLNLNEVVIKKFIEKISEEKKEMFLNGFSHSRVINENQYILIKPIIEYMNENELEENIVARIMEYMILAYMLEYKNSNLKFLDKKENLSVLGIHGIFGVKKSYKKLSENYNGKEFEDKVKKIWNKILEIRWNVEKVEDIEKIKATICAVDNFDNIDDEIIGNIKRIINFVDDGVNYKVFEYLKRILSEENLNSVINCMKTYKSDEWTDYYIIEFCEEIEKILPSDFDDFKQSWLRSNTKDSGLRDYLLQNRKN